MADLARTRLHRALKKLLSMPADPSKPLPKIKALFKTDAYFELDHPRTLIVTEKEVANADTNEQPSACLKRKLSSSPLSSAQQTPTPPFSPATLLKRARMSSGSDDLMMDDMRKKDAPPPDSTSQDEGVQLLMLLKQG
jgi:hypothetical protein